MPSIINPLAGRARTGAKRVEDVGYINRRIVGEYVAEKRLARGMTQMQLAKLLGMTDGAVSAIEMGRNSLSPERYAEMADALNVSRKTFARFLLRYYNPWLFAMIWPDQLPEKALDDVPSRVHDFRTDD